MSFFYTCNDDECNVSTCTAYFSPEYAIHQQVSNRQYSVLSNQCTEILNSLSAVTLNGFFFITEWLGGCSRTRHTVFPKQGNFIFLCKFVLFICQIKMILGKKKKSISKVLECKYLYIKKLLRRNCSISKKIRRLLVVALASDMRNPTQNNCVHCEVTG